MSWPCPKMMPGQTPYTEEEYNNLLGLIEAACVAEEIYDPNDLEGGPPAMQVINTWNGGKGGRQVVFETPLAADAGRDACFVWIHNNTPFSFYEATNNQGYVVEDLREEEGHA